MTSTFRSRRRPGRKCGDMIPIPTAEMRRHDTYSHSSLSPSAEGRPASNHLEAYFRAKVPHTKTTLSVDSAHTRYMAEDKVPLCDRHHSRMRPEPSSFSPMVVFKCASQDCRRYYGRRYGYFDLLPNMAPFPEKIDPDSRFMKVCTTRQTHSYMAITRPKNTASDAKNLWCWHCYECNKGKC